MPKLKPQQDEATESGLLERIDLCLPLEAFQSYQRCREQGDNNLDHHKVKEQLTQTKAQIEHLHAKIVKNKSSDYS